MNKRQPITIREVAAHAGVSQMTVSRVLNKRDLVKEETRQRVEEAIAALNYRPNLLARGLAAGRSLLIGLVYNNPSHGYLGEFLLGALNACRQAGHHLMVEDLFGDGEATPAAVAQRLRASGLQGIIVTPPLSEQADIIRELRRLDLPFVLIAPGGNEGPADFGVAIDDREAAAAMTRLLMDKGHRRIGFITGGQDQAAGRARLEGYRQAHTAAGLDLPAADMVVEGDFTYRSGMEGAERLLDLADAPTAIFASNDDMGAGVVAAAHRRGLRVPQDLSVVGFDDTAIASTIWPQLTTIRQPLAEMADKAVALLEGQATGTEDDPQTAPVLRLDFAIIERNSVGPPPASSRLAAE